MSFLADLAEPVLQFLFETAIDSILQSRKGEQRYGCGCFLVCSVLILLVVGLLIAAGS